MTIRTKFSARQGDCPSIVVARIFVLFLLSAISAYAQIGGTGTIQGTVTDPSGAVVSGATVTAVNTATNVKSTQQTTGAGFYALVALAPGEYNVLAAAPGFSSLTREHVVVDALAIIGLNLTLHVGQVGTDVVVSAAPPMLDTSDATLGVTMRSDLYTALPLAMNGSPRDPTAFVALVPGVNSLATQSAGTSYASFNGGQTFTNEIYVEGIPMTNSAVQGETRNLSLAISVEAVDQFQVETNNPPAMYQGQGIENYVLKSGTNLFHGSLYEYFRNTVLDAAGYFSPTTPVEQQNEFGVQAGGPIKKGRIFFFGAYDGYYYREATTPTYQSIPTLAERQGDFSAFPEPIYDPNTTACNSAGTSCTRTQFPGNIIPANRLSPVSQSLQSYLPAPTNSNLQNNLLTMQPVGLHVNNTTDRIDVHLTEKHLLYGFFSHGQYTTEGVAGISSGTDALPLPYTASRIVDEVPTTVQIHDVYAFSPKLLNQFAYSFSRLWVPILSATEFGAYPEKAGLQGLPAGQASLAFPTVNFSGPNAPIGWGGTNSIAFNNAANTYVAQDNVQWLQGKHSVTMGGQVQWLQDNQTSPDQGSVASFNMNNPETAGYSSNGTILNSTGNPYASYLLGAIDSASLTQNSVATTGARYKNYALYVQDEAKMTSKLTLDLGLRYDIFGVFHEVSNRLSFLNPTLSNPATGGYPGALQFAGSGPDSCHCSSPVKTHYFNFGPRIGIAYSVNDKTVLRGGYALMYARSGAVGGRNYTGTGQLGFSANPSFVTPGNGTPAFFWSAVASLPPAYSGITAGRVPAYAQPPFFDPSLNTGYCTGCNAAGGITFGDPTIGGRPSYYHNFSLGVERSLSSNMTLTVAYSGSLGHFIPTTLGRPDISNQINPSNLALGNLLVSSATPANIAAANAIIPGIKLPYSNFSGPIGQMLVPFPQYSSVNDIYENIGNSSYNSLQLVLAKQLSSGLTFNLSYVRSRELDNIVASARSAYYPQFEWAVGAIDRPNWIAGTFAYKLPFGEGHRLGNNNAFVKQVVGNWEVSGIYTFSSGAPLTITSTSCNAPFTGGLCLPNYNSTFKGPVLINGGPARPKGDVLTSSYIDKSAFEDPAAFAFGNTSRTLPYGLRSPSVWDQDLTVRRQFGITDRYKVIFAVDSFNVFNTVNFGGISTNINSNNFGGVTNQANSPRKLQLDLRVLF